MKQIKLTEFDIKNYNEGGSVHVDHQNKHGISIRGKLTYTSPYAFITDPQYGFMDLFLKPGSPWEKDFWEWMENNSYGDYEERTLYHPCDEIDRTGIYNFVPTPEMLEGYVRRYLESDRK